LSNDTQWLGFSYVTTWMKQCQPKTFYFSSRLAAYWPAPIQAVAHC